MWRNILETIQEKEESKKKLLENLRKCFKHHRTLFCLIKTFVFYVETKDVSISYLQHAKSMRWSSLITLRVVHSVLTRQQICSISLITDLLCTCSKLKTYLLVCYLFSIVFFVSCLQTSLGYLLPQAP